MTKQEIADFLNPALSQICHQIREIDNSYNHDWGILAGLCQNAIDAIRRSDNEEGEIQLEIDSNLKRIKLLTTV